MLIVTERLWLVQDTKFTANDITEFVRSFPGDSFESVNQYPVPFGRFIQRAYNANFILVAYNEEKITGLCVWCRLSKEESYKVDKVRWEFPHDIQNGEVLYVAVCIITNDCTMGLWQMRKLFNVFGYRDKVKQILWFNDKWYRKDLVKCRC